MDPAIHDEANSLREAIRLDGNNIRYWREGTTQLHGLSTEEAKEIEDCIVAIIEARKIRHELKYRNLSTG